MDRNTFNSIKKEEPTEYSLRMAQGILEQLEEKAKDLFLDHADYDIMEWLGEADQKEYKKVFSIVNGYCACCGEGTCKGECS